MTFRVLADVALALLMVHAAAAAAGEGVDASTLEGKVMCGYQGWFRAEGDGSRWRWKHYGREGRFDPRSCAIDLWPDLSEFGEGEKFATPFQHADGSIAFVFSSLNATTVARHFGWMKEYGIDGAFVQRFAVELREVESRAEADRVLENCRHGAAQHGRAWAVMYDLTGIEAGETRLVVEDWERLVAEQGISVADGYLRHRGKPVVAVWGVGFGDGRKYSLAECAQMVDALAGGKGGRCTVLLGVPTGWRTLDRDSLRDPALHALLAKADVLSPWTVGRYRSPEEAEAHAARDWSADRTWCSERGIDYLPVVFPGFSWHNLVPGAPSDEIPRLKGRFLWSQFVGAARAGASMVYVAMFDEMDEGTAIFKCTNNPPAGASSFLTYEGLPSDFYLRLAGTGGRLLRGEIPLSENPAVPQGLTD